MELVGVAAVGRNLAVDLRYEMIASGNEFKGKPLSHRSQILHDGRPGSQASGISLGMVAIGINDVSFIANGIFETGYFTHMGQTALGAEANAAVSSLQIDFGSQVKVAVRFFAE